MIRPVSTSSITTPKITTPKPEESRLRRILKVFCDYLPCLKGIVDWIAPEYTLVRGGSCFKPVNYKIQEVSTSKLPSTTLYSGKMDGCHVVIGISPDGEEQLFAHNNPMFVGSEGPNLYLRDGSPQSTKAMMTRNADKNWTYYLFMTPHTKRESGSGLQTIDEFYQGTIRSWYEDFISEIIYIDCLQSHYVDLKYSPSSRTLEVDAVTIQGAKDAVIHYTTQLSPPPSKLIPKKVQESASRRD